MSEFSVVSLLAKIVGVSVVPHVGDMGRLYQHLVLFNPIALSHEALFLEQISHLHDRFSTPPRRRGRAPNSTGGRGELRPGGPFTVGRRWSRLIDGASRLGTDAVASNGWPSVVARWLAQPGGDRGNRLALRFRYGVTPSNIDTGAAIVDRHNVDQIIELTAAGYRR